MSGWTARGLALEVLAIGLGSWIVFHNLRAHVAERYTIPSRSMEPTLHGDPHDGDRVLVDKTAFWSSPLWSWHRRPLNRHDLVVLRNRHQRDGAHLVKRFIAQGPAELALREGDLFVREGEQRTLERDVKHPLEQAGYRQTAFVVDPAARAAESGELLGQDAVEGDALVLAARPRDALVAQLSPQAQAARRAQRPPTQQLAGFLRTGAAIDTAFLDATGELLAIRRGEVRDVGLELELALDAGVESLLLVFEAVEVYHALEYSAAGRLRCSVMGAPARDELVVPSLPLGRTLQLAYGYLDGRLFVIADGVLIAWFEHTVEFRSPRELQPGETFARPEANLLHLGVAGTGRVRIARVRGFHDVHWQPRSESFRLEPGELFVLGENSYDSSDSRDHPGDPFRIEDLVGRPIGVLAPGSRRRWL